MRYTFGTKNTCASKIEFDLDGDTITNVVFTGGCDGNLKAIPRLVDGLTVDEIVKKLDGVTCGRKNTSCADQLARAVKAAREAI